MVDFDRPSADDVCGFVSVGNTKCPAEHRKVRHHLRTGSPLLIIRCQRTGGALAKIDDEGFIQITGRQSRFSKIGGEMVPHIRIEQEIARILDERPNDESEIVYAVTAVPDASKGERLIVLHKPMQKSVREITDQLQQAGLPNLWIPSSNSFFEVSHIPLLGTGKRDLRAVKEMAMSRCQGNL